MRACLDCFQGKRTVHFNVSIDLIATQKLNFLGYQYIQYILDIYFNVLVSPLGNERNYENPLAYDDVRTDI